MKANEDAAIEHKDRKIIHEPGYIEEAEIIILKFKNIIVAAAEETVMLMPNLLSMAKKTNKDRKGKALLHIRIAFKLFPVR